MFGAEAAARIKTKFNARWITNNCEYASCANEISTNQ